MRQDTRVTPWVSDRDLAAKADVRLFCLPHAGSGAAGFHRWKRLLPDFIAVCPVMLPGRETRLGEASGRSLAEIVSSLHESLKPILNEPFAIFGHSMGAALAYEWERSIERDGLRAECLFVSGREAPHVASQHQDLQTLPDDDLIRELGARWGGTQDALLADAEMRALFLPILRGDLAMLAEYRGTNDSRLTAPLRAFAGLEDRSVSSEGLAAWGAVAGAGFSAERFPGGHFYHFGEGQKELLAVVANVLNVSGQSSRA